MEKRREIFGQEAIEVGLVGVIVLCLSIGAVVIFGDQIQKVFQGDTSPVMASANLKDSSDIADAEGEGSRTNITKSLVSEDVITKPATDLSIGSAVGQETTGATGGDAEIGGTYEVTNAAALADGDPSTTGNALLDAAMAARKTAMGLLDSAKSAKAMAELLQDKAAGLAAKADQGQELLDSLEDGLVAYGDQVTLINDHLEGLIGDYYSNLFSGFSALLGVDTSALVNDLVVAQTDANLLSGNSLLSINAEQNSAQDLYDQMQADYDAGWVTVCDEEDPANCEDVNESGITLEDLSTQLDVVNSYLEDIEGQAAGLENTISDLEDTVDDLYDQADDAYHDAHHLKDDARDTIKEAFHWGSFSGCWTMDDYIARAEWLIANDPSKIKDEDAADSALELLYSAKDAYEQAAELKAEAEATQANIAQKQAILDALLSGSSSITLEADTQVLEDLIDQQEAAFAALSALDAEIHLTVDELTRVEGLMIDTADAIDTQQAMVNTLNNSANQAALNAADATSEANDLVVAAGDAINDANETIDAIVCFPEEQPCE